MITRAWEYALAHEEELVDALLQHLALTGTVMGIVLLLCIPMGVWAARSKWAAAGLINMANSLRVIPSLAVLFLAIPYFGLNFSAAVLALTLLAAPPVLINTVTAFRSLDPFILEAARGLGMSKHQRLAKVEFPLAAPVILAGVRTSVVEVIASATLAAFIGAGGLGIYITRGLALFDASILIVGAVPVAALTLGFEGAFGWLEKRFRSLP